VYITTNQNYQLVEWNCH